MWKDKKILFQLSGSIACFKACELISELVKSGAQVQCVASVNALKFVGTATLEGLTGNTVLTDTFASGGAHDHIYKMRWADMILLCPASANKINQLANGTATDLIGTLFLAHKFDKPYFIVPAMNEAMYLHPITNASIQKLLEIGINVLPTDKGSLACGETGEGRMLEPMKILEIIKNR